MNVPLVLTHFLDRAVSLYGDKVGVISEGKSLTYLELSERVNQLSHGLSALGVKRGPCRLFSAKYVRDARRILRRISNRSDHGAAQHPLKTGRLRIYFKP
ncbi:hypothetical protein LR68_04438 [Anoxybacillus sp. BCO1]|nr:hypothetical protein LR68_04438 [Anoxybacillus sp. BCO1]